MMWSDNSDIEYERKERANAAQGRLRLHRSRRARVIVTRALDTLGTNLESAASMAAMHRIGYTRGFEAGRTLAEFCEDYAPEPYFPMADSRPTAERIDWEYCSHMKGAAGSCARCEGT